MTDKQKKKTGRPAGKKESREAKRVKRDRQIIELYQKNTPTRQIAKIVECAPATVNLTLRNFKNMLKTLENPTEWENRKAEILDIALFELLKSMMEQGKLDKASINGLAFAYDKLNNARRLERGLSTSNVQVAQFTEIKVSKYRKDSDD